MPLQVCLRIRCAEAGDPDDAAGCACGLAGALRHAGEGWAHLASDAEDDDVALETAHHVDERGRGPAELRFEVGDVCGRHEVVIMKPRGSGFESLLCLI